MKKENIGSVVILVGIGIIGFIWFKRNKPTTSDKQLADLTAQSNALNTGSAENIDKPFEYSQEVINTAGSNPYSSSTVGDMYSNMTPAEINALGEAVNQACPSCAGLANLGTSQITQNMQNADFSQLGNLGLANIDWSNIKIK
jgi:hypothetical protein